MDGALPPVPQFILASPDTGHMASLNNRQRANLHEAGSQKRIGKLKSLGPNKTKGAPLNNINRLNLVQSQSTPPQNQMQRSTQQPTMSVDEIELRQAYQQQSYVGEGRYLNSDLMSEGVAERLNSINVNSRIQQLIPDGESNSNYTGASGAPSSDRSSYRRVTDFANQQQKGSQILDPATQTSKFGGVSY